MTIAWKDEGATIFVLDVVKGVRGSVVGISVSNVSKGVIFKNVCV